MKKIIIDNRSDAESQAVFDMVAHADDQRMAHELSDFSGMIQRYNKTTYLISVKENKKSVRFTVTNIN